MVGGGCLHGLIDYIGAKQIQILCIIHHGDGGKKKRDLLVHAKRGRVSATTRCVRISQRPFRDIEMYSML